MAISIMNGAVLKFEIDFTVPAGTTLSQIDVKDTLQLGLNVLDVTCSVNGTPKTVQDGTGDYALTKTPFAAPDTPSDFTLTITDPAVIDNPAEDISSEEEVNFNEYRLYGYGGSDTIQRQAGEETLFPIHIPTFDAYSALDAGGDPELKYVVNLTPNEELGVTIDENDVKVYNYKSDGTVEELVKDTDFTVDTATPGVLKVTIPHSDILRSSTIYIVPSGATTDEVTKHNNNPVYSRATLTLDDATATVLTADPFDVTTNINDDLITLVKKTLV